MKNPNDIDQWALRSRMNGREIINTHLKPIFYDGDYGKAASLYGLTDADMLRLREGESLEINRKGGGVNVYSIKKAFQGSDRLAVCEEVWK